MSPKHFIRHFRLLPLIFLSAFHAHAAEDPMKPFEVIEKSIVTSPNDSREYQVIRLRNELTVLLVSDPDLKNSAASLSVPIGSMHNPDSQLGLAHYLEHMLFLGSERYPIINDYSKFMSQNGGYTNAYTAQESTVYGFEVNDSAFAEALDRLGDVMRAPLLDEQYAEKERHTVNAEHKTYFDNDMRKLYALQRYSLNPEHPMSRFSTGDLSTLVDKPGSDLHEELAAFFKRYYSANLMKVALTSPRSIAEMQKIAVKYLTQIPDNHVTKPVILTPLLTDQQRALAVNIKPTADLRFLQVNFLVPNLKDEYMYQPGGYISRLIGSDHKGGLSDYLQKAGLTESVSAGFYAALSDHYSQFSITFRLTEKGLTDQDTVLASLFAYIKLIKEKGVNELQYSEQKKSIDNYFQFLPKNAGFDYVMSLSAIMQQYPLSDVIAYRYRLDGFKEKFIQGVLDYLTPENSRVFLMSPDAQVDTDIPFYQGQYSQHKIPESRLQHWLDQAESIETHMTLPLVNKWLPEDLSIIHEDKDKQAVHLIDKPGLSVWMKQSKLNEPKGYYRLQLNNDVSDRSPKNRVAMSLLLDLVQKELSDLRHIAQEAGLGFSISSNNGLLISTSGYNDKQQKLLLKLVDYVHHFHIDKQALMLSKQALIRRLKNRATIKPLDLAFSGFRQIVRQPAWSDDTLLKAVNGVSEADLLALIEDVFSQSMVRLLAVGNFSTATVNQLTESLTTRIHVADQSPYKTKRLNANTQQGALNYVRQSTKEDDALISIYLTKSNGDSSIAKAELLNKLLRPAFYNQIRTQEQLTYSPFTATYQVDKSLAFGFFTQSPSVSSAVLYQRFQAFLDSFKVILKQTTEAEFEKIKQAHIANYLTKPTNLSAEFAYLVNEWLDNKAQIDTKLNYVQALQKVTLEQVKAYYLTLFFEPKQIQQLVIQVKGKQFASEAPMQLPQQVSITDIDALPKS